MLFDFGWSEILLISTVALIFIGPKDLPKALRVAGYWVRKARTLSREFQSSIDQMIREAELDEMRQELKKVTEFDLNKEFQNTIDPTGDLRESLKPPELPDFCTATAAPAPNAPSEVEPIAGAPEPAAAPAPSTGAPAASAAPGGTWPASGGTGIEPAEPVPMVAGPESEPDEIGAAQPPQPAPPPQPGDRGVAAPKP